MREAFYLNKIAFVCTPKKIWGLPKLAKTSQKYPSQRNDQSRKQHTGCCELHIGQNAANGLCFDLLRQIVLG